MKKLFKLNGKTKIMNDDDIAIPLTATQIRDFDEIVFDRKASNDSLKVSIQYHQNRMAFIARKEREMWDELIKTHNLDPDKKWTYRAVNSQVCIVEVTEDLDY